MGCLELRFAQDDEVRNPFGQDALGRLQRALVVALGQHDRLQVALGANQHGIKKCTHRHYPFAYMIEARTTEGMRKKRWLYDSVPAGWVFR